MKGWASQSESHSSASEFLGYLAAFAAFFLWGVLPVYWKALAEVVPQEILAHRILWTLLFSLLLLCAGKRAKEVKEIFKTWNRRFYVFCAACMLGLNWYTFIYAVNSGHVMDCSLGYYINPLLNVFLGFVFLRERFSVKQGAAIVFATLGVMNATLLYGKLPLIALALACTFGFYGLLRKKAHYEALPGLVCEMALLLPFSLSYLLSRAEESLHTAFCEGLPRAGLLLGTGIVTATPLLLFTYAARRIRLATVGFIQYLTPTGMFLLGVFAYKEPFSMKQALTFILIWIGVVLYLWDTVGDRTSQPPP